MTPFDPDAYWLGRERDDEFHAPAYYCAACGFAEYVGTPDDHCTRCGHSERESA